MTDDFSEANKIGEGGFGSVYKVNTPWMSLYYRHFGPIYDSSHFISRVAPIEGISWLVRGDLKVERLLQ